MEKVETEINKLIKAYEKQKDKDDADSLDIAFANCSISTLRILKYNLGLD